MTDLLKLRTVDFVYKLPQRRGTWYCYVLFTVSFTASDTCIRRRRLRLGRILSDIDPVWKRALTKCQFVLASDRSDTLLPSGDRAFWGQFLYHK